MSRHWRDQPDPPDILFGRAPLSPGEAHELAVAVAVAVAERRERKLAEADSIIEQITKLLTEPTGPGTFDEIEHALARAESWRSRP